jgi:hypothetical protein
VNQKKRMGQVARMFAAHGSLKPAEVVVELAEETMLERYCQPCAEKVLDEGRGGKYPLTVQTFREAYARQSEGVDHGFHIGQTDRETEVGEAEARWRGADVDALVAAGEPRQRAEVMAAMRWASGIVSPGDDLDLAAWERHTPRVCDNACIDAAWTYARAIAMAGDVTAISEEAWQAILGPWEKAWRQAS